MNIEQNPGGFSVVRHTLCKHFYCIFNIYIYYSDFISCVQGHPKLCFSKKKLSSCGVDEVSPLGVVR